MPKSHPYKCHLKPWKGNKLFQNILFAHSFKENVTNMQERNPLMMLNWDLCGSTPYGLGSLRFVVLLKRIFKLVLCSERYKGGIQRVYVAFSF